MGREIRKVPAEWEHPKNEPGHYIPLLGRSFAKSLADWEEGKQKWSEGLRLDWHNKEWVPIEKRYIKYTYEEWDGKRPEKDDYMPEWSDEEKTRIQLPH